MSGQIPVINGAIRLEGDTSRLPKMVEDARRVGKQIEKEFEANFTRIGRLAEKALSNPRTVTGALDIDVDSIRRATEESRKLASVQREIATAARAAANADSKDNPEPRLRAIAKAAEAKARAYELDAHEAERNYQAHVKLNAELAKTEQAMLRTGRTGPNMSSGAESILQGKAALDRAAVSGVSLEQVLGRVNRKGIEVAQSLTSIGQAQETLAQAIQRTNRATMSATHSQTGAEKILGGAASIDRAAVSLATLESVMGRVTREGQKSKDALLGMSAAAENVERAAKRGTTANQMMVNSTRSLRVATVQAGQQLQDIGISLYGGQKASVVFAQQLPQLAFALSGLEGSANKTHDRIGRFATFLSGPWGLAVGLGVGVLATLVTSLFETGDAADEAKDKTYDFSNGLDVLTLSATSTANAMKQLAAEMRSAIAVQGNFLKTSALVAGQSVTGIQGRLSDNTARRETLKGQIGGFTMDPTEGIRRASEIAKLDAAIAADRAALGSAQQALADAQIAVSQQGALERLDPKTKARGDFERSVGELNKRFRKSQNGDPLNAALDPNYLSQEGYDKEFTRLQSGYNATVESLKPPKKGPKDNSARDAERAANAAARLAEFGRDAQASIEAIGRSFDDTPPAIQESARELERLNDLSADIMMKKPEGWQAMLAAIQAIRPEAEALASGPYKHMLEDSAEQARIEQLLIAGKTEEAEVQRRIHQLTQAMGPLTAEQEATTRDIVTQERVRARLLEIQADTRQRELNYLEDTRANIQQTAYDLLSGKGATSIGNFFKRQFDSVLRNMAESITDQLFGDIFRNEKDRILGFDKVKESSIQLAKTTNVAEEALKKLSHAVDSASGALNGAANDNQIPSADGADIVVQREKSTGRVMKDALKGIGKDIFGEETFTKLSGVFKTGMQGAAIGQMSSGIAKSLGLKQSKTGAQIGGALGNFIPGLPPGVGAALGGLVGGTIGGLMKKTKSGSANITGTGDATLSGNSGAFKKAAGGAAKSVQGSLQNIAEALGGSVGGFNVSIGQRHGDWRVREGAGSLKKKKGATDFDDDQESAIKYAISLAVQQGAILGLKASTKRLLESGSDVEAQLAKAVSFQSVFDELDAIKDPVGAAVKTLNREFEGLIKIFGEAGASAEEYAQLEELYGLKRADAVKQANEQIIGSLKSFYDDLTVGNDALSLRDRGAAAKANYDPLAARVAAGDTSAYDAYAEAAAAYLEIQRMMSGSQSDYFALNDAITSLTKSAIDSQTALAGSGTSLPNPFTAASGSTATAATTPVVTAINQQTLDMLKALGAVNDNLGTIIMQGTAASGTKKTGFRSYF